jgi:hypothetical protein
MITSAQPVLANNLAAGKPGVLAMLEELLGHKVVVDLLGPFVCLGKLVRADERHLELKNADFHDLRDTQTTRENYVISSILTGVKRNRKSVLLVRAEVVAVSRLADVVVD